MPRNKAKSRISAILNSISPQEAKRIENRMLVAVKIDDAMKAKGWRKKDLIKAMGRKNPSEVTRWLSGTHNFTLDTLTDLGMALNVDFLNLEDNEQIAKGNSFRAKSVKVYINQQQSYHDQLVSSPLAHYSTQHSPNE